MICYGTNQIVGERRDLFNPTDCHIGDPLVLALLDKGVIDLAWRT